MNGDKFKPRNRKLDDERVVSGLQWVPGSHCQRTGAQVAAMVRFVGVTAVQD